MNEHSADKPNPGRFLASLFALDGRCGVVIGGTGVLGGAICETLAAAGAHVAVVGRTLKTDEHGRTVLDRIGAQGGSAEFLAADCTRREDLQSVLDRLVGAGRTPDILVNGAGINSATPFLEISDEEWQRILDVNLNSVRLACQVFGRYWLDNGVAASVINIASVSAELPLSRVFTYAASKAAVLNLTRNLAREWAPHGIRVNALSPGFFPAEQNRKVLTPERVESIMRHTPLRRFGSPEELAGAVLLLASNTAGSFVVGTNLVVDGGFTAMTI